MQDKWLDLLDVEGKDLQVIGTGHQDLFSVQEPGVPFRWVQIIHGGGNIYAARMLPIVVPADVVVQNGTSVAEVIRAAGPDRCFAAVTYERRPYPALVKDAVGKTVCEIPGGVGDGKDARPANTGLREFLEEMGAEEELVISQGALLDAPSPSSAGAQIEGYSLYCTAYRAGKDFSVCADEPIEKYELLPLRSAYHALLGRHERREQCVDMKTLLSLLMLQQQYADLFGEELFRKGANG